MKAWGQLRGLDPDDVCRRAGCSFDTSNESFALECFGQTLKVCYRDSTISAEKISAAGKYLTDDLGDLFRLSILLYLIGAQEEKFPSGKLVKPSDLEGGAIYLQGSHMLPLDSLAEKFGGDPSKFLAFLETGKSLGGKESGYGDVSIQLFPFPRIPVVIAVWAGDDEFPPRSALLFDSTCELHLPPDALWAVATVSVRVMQR